MLRLGLLGTQSGHSASFAGIAAKHADKLSFTWAWDPDRDNAASFCQRFSIPHQADSFEQLVHRVDAVMITGRDGAQHAAQALPFLEAGYPVWVDKPFSISLEDSLQMLDAAKRSKALLCGGSNLKYCPSVLRAKALCDGLQSEGKLLSASFNFQAMMDSPYHGLHFYGPHSLDIVLTVFGRNIESLSCHQHAQGATAVFDMGRISVTAHLYDCWDAHFTAYTPTKAHSLPLGLFRLHENGLRAFVQMIEGKQPAQSAESLLDPVILMNSLIQSMEQGGRSIPAPLSNF